MFGLCKTRQDQACIRPRCQGTGEEREKGVKRGSATLPTFGLVLCHVLCISRSVVVAHSLV